MIENVLTPGISLDPLAVSDRPPALNSWTKKVCVWGGRGVDLLASAFKLCKRQGWNQTQGQLDPGTQRPSFSPPPNCCSTPTSLPPSVSVDMARFVRLIACTPHMM